MEITIEEWNQRKEFANFKQDDIEALIAIKDKIRQKAEDVIDQLYVHMLEYSHLQEILYDESILVRLKGMQKRYFEQLFEGEYGEDYLINRLNIGRVHHRIGLEPSWYMGTYSHYIELIVPIIFETLDDAKIIQKTVLALMKLINLDQELAITTYLSAREEVIMQQSEEIMEISVPVIQVWEGIIAAPIIGTLDTARTQLLMEKLLEGVVETKTRVVLLDITGVPSIDTATAQHIIDTINAVKLLGSEVVITGVSPAIAQTLVHLGIDLSGITTRSALAQGLKVALTKLNLELKAGSNG